MKKIDIFATTRFDYRKDSFSIYDDKQLPEEPAFIIDYGDNREIAKVENPNHWDIYFIPIDKNIIYFKANGSKESQCDAMLITINPSNNYGLYFIELKNKRVAWVTEGKNQLKQTILDFKSCYNCSIPCIYEKRAYLCNKKKKSPLFENNLNALKEEFFDETGFNLRVNISIPIK